MRNWFKRRSATPVLVSTDTSPNGAYSGLRQLAFATNRTEGGEIPAPSPDAPAWGVLMETGLGEVTVTLRALGDGTTSLYFSHGAFILGGNTNEVLCKATKAFIDQANKSLPHLEPCDVFPIPAAEHTVFYVLTDSGLLTGGALQNDLGYGRHPLSTLFHSGHEVFSQLRMISEANKTGT
jgi:hypothetical protein